MCGFDFKKLSGHPHYFPQFLANRNQDYYGIFNLVFRVERGNLGTRLEYCLRSRRRLLIVLLWQWLN